MSGLVDRTFGTFSRADAERHWDFLKARYRYRFPKAEGDSWNSKLNSSFAIQFGAWKDVVLGGDLEASRVVDVLLRKQYDQLDGQESRDAVAEFVSILRSRQESENGTVDPVVLLAGPELERLIARYYTRPSLLARLRQATSLIFGDKKGKMDVIEKLEKDPIQL